MRALRFLRLPGFLKDVLLIDALIFAGGALVCWLAGWHSMFLYGKSLAWIGTATILFGLFGLIGNLGVTRSYRQNFYSEHKGNRTMWEHIQLGMDEEERSISFFNYSFLIGALPFLIGWLLQLFF